MRKILLVEDDASLGQTLTERLAKEYEIRWAQSVQGALELLKNDSALDLLILDVNLPDGTGFDIAEFVRTKTHQPLFIFLTAQSDAESRLKGFEIGAEEFIPKPFHLKELLIRVKHVLDLHAPQMEVKIEDVVINFTALSVKKANGALEYPPITDLKIMQLLMDRAPRVVSRDEIINEIWGVDKNPSHRTIDNTIVRLRQLIGEKGEHYIRSVRGVGYQWFKENEE